MPEEVRKTTEDKVKGLESERAAMEAAKRQFESIRDD